MCAECTPVPQLVHSVSGFESLAAGAPYGGPIKAAIRTYKYRFVSTLSVPLGDVVADAALLLPPFDAIVPVPLHPSRLRWRGFDQSQLLAERVALRSGKPIVRGIERTRPTETQASLGWSDRLQNVSGAFTANVQLPPNIVLIDDVATTGATLRACAEAARHGGAISVSAAVIAWGT